MEFDIFQTISGIQRNGIGPRDTAAAVRPAEELRSDRKFDPVHSMCRKRGCCQSAPAFDQQSGNILGTEFFQITIRDDRSQ